MATVLRQAVVTHLMGVMQARVSATPSTSQLAVCYRTRPPGVIAEPFGYIGEWNETIAHDSGTRSRVVDTSLVLGVTLVADPDQTLGRLDVLTDTFLDALTAAGMAISSVAGPVLPVSVESAEDSQEGGGQYELVVINIRTSYREGRPT